MKQAPVATLLMMLATASLGAGSAAAQTAAARPAAPKATPKATPKTDANGDSRGNTKPDPATQADRLALQSDLAWIGDYNGAVTGEANDRLTAAVKAFQARNGGKATGTLSASERAALAAQARSLQDHVGWTMTDDANGMRLGLPAKLAPQQGAGRTGTRWTSAQGQIQIETWRLREAGLTLQAVAAREKKEPAGRRVEYSVVRPEFFVLSGLQGLKKFYVRGHARGDEVRGLTILYDQATEGLMGPVVVAMSSAFSPWPGAPRTSATPPPRRKVEYATGFVAGAEGAILTDRQAVTECQSIIVQGYGHAERVAEDTARDLALLRVYGAANLKPLALNGGTARPEVTLIGIADPLTQDGAAVVSTASGRTGAVNGGDMALAPAPALGFSGAPAFDSDGRFAGLALLKAAAVAGPAAAPAAALVPAEAVRAFLAANTVAVSGTAADPKASVLRIICVRK
ncbi:MAG: peptidoglycan-binding protein [Xanthobacteraceae bacterium]|nr:MAG: peptidoglycan-binding protein [Xanthobacteraceae bacterium]